MSTQPSLRKSCDWRQLWPTLEPLELLMWLFVHGVLEEFLGAVKKAARNSCDICCEKQSRDGSTAVSSPDAGCYQGDTIQISPFASPVDNNTIVAAVACLTKMIKEDCKALCKQLRWWIGVSSAETFWSAIFFSLVWGLTRNVLFVVQVEQVVARLQELQRTIAGLHLSPHANRRMSYRSSRVDHTSCLSSKRSLFEFLLSHTHCTKTLRAPAHETILNPAFTELVFTRHYGLQGFWAHWFSVMFCRLLEPDGYGKRICSSSTLDHQGTIISNLVHFKLF